MQNKYVFSVLLNTDSDEADVTSLGRLFHTFAAATGKARPPVLPLLRNCLTYSYTKIYTVAVLSIN